MPLIITEKSDMIFRVLKISLGIICITIGLLYGTNNKCYFMKEYRTITTLSLILVISLVFLRTQFLLNMVRKGISL